MTRVATAYTGAAIHDGTRLHQGAALLLPGDGTMALCPPETLPEGVLCEQLPGGTLLPGFVDLQVNGGGGLLLNDAPSVDTLATMAEAHRALGCAAILPTLITDTPAKTEAAIEAVAAAQRVGLSGIAGLHLEGPHLAQARKGAHDGALIRPMTEADLSCLVRAAERIGTLKVTLAPESVTIAQITALAEAGVLVSLGHSDCDYDTAMRAFEAGARCVTHLFNAMSPLTSRAPGLVGAALTYGAVSVGLIADAVHVHPQTMRLALRAKPPPGEIFLVSDAMAVAGTDLTGFPLNGRAVLRRDGRLTLEDGTLAGADLCLSRALAVLTRDCGEDLQGAIHRATAAPTALLREAGGLGQLGGPGGVLHLSDDLSDLRWLQEPDA